MSCAGQFFHFFLFLCVFVCLVGRSSGYSIGFVTLPTHGHIGPIKTLAAAAAERGHEILIFSTQESQEKLIDTDYKLYILGNTTVDKIAQKALGPDKDEHSLTDLPALFSELEREFLSHMLSIFQQMKINQELPDVLVVDFLAFAGFDIAEVFDIPVVVSLPGLYPPAYYKPNWMPGNSEKLTLLRRFKGQATKLIENALQYAFYYHSNQVRSEFGLKSWEKFDSSVFSNAITFQFSFLPLVEPGPTVGGSIHYIGLPFKPKDDQKLDAVAMSWIKQQDKKIIFVSFGTIAKQSTEKLDYLWDQMVQCTEYSFIWSLRDEILARSEKISAAIASNTPDHILRVSWINQVALLDQVDLFFTHGGYNSLAETIYASVPIVCMPFMADQPDNCNRVVQIGLGIQMDKEDMESNLCKEFSKILSEKKFKENAKLLSHYARAASKHGLDSAIDTLELISKYGTEPLVPLDYSAPFYKRFDWDIFAIQLFLSCCVGFFLCKMLLLQDR